MSQRMRVVVCGCGGISGLWFKCLQDIPAIEVVGIVDLNEKAAEARKAEFGLAKAQTGGDLAAMLKLTKPEAVFDCTFPGAHSLVATTALKHGCHVLGEKPMADSMENARKSLAAAKKSGRVYAVMQNRRHTPGVIAYRNLIQSGKLGEPTMLHANFLIGCHFNSSFQQHMKHVLLLDMAIHTFDEARFLSGADPVGVFCKDWNPKGSWFDHEAAAVAVFEMSHGVTFTYRGSWAAQGLNTAWDAEWSCVCTKGSGTWDGREAIRAERVTKVTGGFFDKLAPVSVKVPKMKWDYHAALLRDFVDCIRAGRRPQTHAADNIRSLAMVFAAIESSETGKFVKIRA